MTYDYHTGLKSKAAALEAIEDAIAAGEISESEKPTVKPYKITPTTGPQLTRWKIKLED